MLVSESRVKRGLRMLKSHQFDVVQVCERQGRGKPGLLQVSEKIVMI